LSIMEFSRERELIYAAQEEVEERAYEELLEKAKRSLLKGYSIETVCDITELDFNTVSALQQETQ